MRHDISHTELLFALQCNKGSVATGTCTNTSAVAEAIGSLCCDTINNLIQVCAATIACIWAVQLSTYVFADLIRLPQIHASAARVSPTLSFLGLNPLNLYLSMFITDIRCIGQIQTLVFSCRFQYGKLSCLLKPYSSEKLVFEAAQSLHDPMNRSTSNAHSTWCMVWCSRSPSCYLYSCRKFGRHRFMTQWLSCPKRRPTVRMSTLPSLLFSCRPLRNLNNRIFQNAITRTAYTGGPRLQDFRPLTCTQIVCFWLLGSLP